MNVRLMQRDGVPTLYLNDQLLVMVHDDLATAYDRSADLLAIAWANNLLIALGQSPMSLVEAQTQLYGLAYTGEVMDGLASWYGPYFHGRITATGETFDQTELTAAHPSLPFGTYLEVINLDNDQSVIVRINDRGPYVGERSLDLSHQAAQCINSEGSGVVNYEAHVLAALPQTPPTSSAALVNDHLIAQAQERLQDNPS
jgi:rare lipoprotein A